MSLQFLGLAGSLRINPPIAVLLRAAQGQYRQG